MIKIIENLAPKTLKDNLVILNELKKTNKEERTVISNKIIKNATSICKKIKIQPVIIAGHDGNIYLYFKNIPRHVKVEVKVMENEFKSRIIFDPSKDDYYFFDCNNVFTSIKNIVKYIDWITKYEFLI